MSECNPETCSYHLMTEAIIGDLKSSVGELVKGQTDMRESFIKLTEAFKMVNRLEERLDKIEEKYEAKIEDNTKFKIKVSAIIGAAISFIPIAVLLWKVFGEN